MRDFLIMCCHQLVNNLNYFPITFNVYSTRALSVVVSFQDHIAESRPTTIKASSLLSKYYKELITDDVYKEWLQSVVNGKNCTFSGVPSHDKSGRKKPSNKISQDRIDVIKEQIKEFPLYTIHYRRKKPRALNI